jgi:hypothetical protein
MEKRLETCLYADNWHNLLGSMLTDEEKIQLDKAPDTAILSCLKLANVIGKVRAKELVALSGACAEIDFSGGRRCVMVIDNKRCKRYNTLPCCEDHYGDAMSLSPAVFKNQDLRNAYLRQLQNPRKIQLDTEVALMRTMMELMLKKVSADTGNMPLELIGAITAMCEKTSVVVEKMSKLNAITPEKIDEMMDRVVEIISEYLPHDKLRECAEKLKMVQISAPGCEIGYNPGDQVTMMLGEETPVDSEVTTVHKRAMLDLQSRL